MTFLFAIHLSREPHLSLILPEKVHNRQKGNEGGLMSRVEENSIISLASDEGEFDNDDVEIISACTNRGPTNTDTRTAPGQQEVIDVDALVEDTEVVHDDDDDGDDDDIQFLSESRAATPVERADVIVTPNGDFPIPPRRVTLIQRAPFQNARYPQTSRILNPSELVFRTQEARRRRQRTIQARRRNLQNLFANHGSSNRIFFHRIGSHNQGAFEDDPDDPDYEYGQEMLPGPFGAVFVNSHILGRRNDYVDENNMARVMRMIAESEENMEDQRVDSRHRLARTVRKKKESASKIRTKTEEASFFTNKIDNSDDLRCLLCGMQLGSGFPADFKVDHEQNSASGILKYKVPAPWQCCNQVTDVDKELSKKVFFAKCGHVYCGRCVNNIMRSDLRKRNRKSQSILQALNYQLLSTIKSPDELKEKIVEEFNSKTTKQKKPSKITKEELNISYEDICSPSVCSGWNCSQRLRNGKKAFREIYY
ncbi:uncharacterized protein PAS_chr4_0997 [Komagataella phaffii GS115]|uniref:Uncharacterized protein n=2 Tax=Komagataella phaffii TaxID=460519 RepID=C4R904_KOMPG|nr:uncharacterized protein PAS_chr4_0997 [Komagataella phaffii GS115]AOA65306.1 GQ67_05201T0 [Komagataella phaffii]AOA69568.1 GQ68_05183T0 [Komagataella phaffii GS115]CAY72079.1 hypothetical protein PAS_chr4_0997 [Komagataella phaffii GS115]